MSAVITPFGIQADSQAQIVANLQAAYRSIYGEEIELEPNTPDGQVIGIFAQMASDLSELVKGLFASLFPSTAEGVFLDYNLDLIGIRRVNGRPASVNIKIEFEGTRDIAAQAFIVRMQGVDFQNDTDIASAGTYIFTAMESGAMQFAQDEPVTIITSVAGVSASFAGTGSPGADYETDSDFRRRWLELIETRDRSALNGQPSGSSVNGQSTGSSFNGQFICFPPVFWLRVPVSSP